MDGLDAAWQSRDGCEATLETMLALQAYRRDHGTFPANLNELIPDYLSSLSMSILAGSRRRPAALPPRTNFSKHLRLESRPKNQVDDCGAIDAPTRQSLDVGFELE